MVARGFFCVKADAFITETSRIIRLLIMLLQTFFYSCPSITHPQPHPSLILYKALGAIESDGGGEAYPPAVRDLLVSTYLYNLGFLRLAVLGEYKSAVEVLSRAQALRSTILGDLHPLTVQVVVSRGHALSLTGNTYLAVNELTRYVALKQKGVSELCPKRLEIEKASDLAQTQKRWNQAIALAMHGKGLTRREGGVGWYLDW